MQLIRFHVCLQSMISTDSDSMYADSDSVTHLSQEDQTAMPVQRVARHRIRPLRGAIRAGQIFRRENQYHARGSLESVVHAFKKVLIGKIPVLKDCRIACVLENRTNPLSDIGLCPGS